MVHLPRIHKTKTGKLFFLVNGKKVFIKSRMRKGELSGHLQGIEETN